MCFVKDGQAHKKLAQTLFYPPRLRSLCTWRRAMKQPNQLTQILEKAIKQQKTVHFLFLTPTVENTHKQKRPVEGALHGLLFSSGINRPPLLPISYLVLMQKKIPVVIITDNSDVERFAFFLGIELLLSVSVKRTGSTANMTLQKISGVGQ